MKNWLVILLVFVGVSVGIISLYSASLSGVMGKMGLVGGDFSQAVNTKELEKQLTQQKLEIDCGFVVIAKKIPHYLFSKNEERVEQAGELGGERIICGVRLVQQGNVERGVYTMVKGLYYLKTYYTEMRAIVQGNRDKCNLLTSPNYERSVEGYLMATEGRIHEIVLNGYKQVEFARSRVEELCTD